MKLRLSLLLLAAFAAPAQPVRRAVLIDIDGIRHDTFQQTYEAGKLPNLARIFASAIWYEHAMTVTPPVTMAGQASIVTGAPPVRHGVVGNQWYDREGQHLFDYMKAAGISCVYGFSVISGPMCLTGLGNRHLQTQTLYEAAAAQGFDSVVAYNQYWRGASRPAAPTADEARAFLPGNKLDFRLFDTQMTGRAIAEIQSRGLPAILTLYFTGADTIAHTDGIGAQPGYLSEVIDQMVGHVLDVVANRDPDWKEHTLFLLTSDHGRTDVAAHPEDVSLQQDMQAILPEGSVVAENGGMAFVYLSQPDESAARRIGEKFASVVETVRPRGSNDSARAGDLIVRLRPGHYFGNSGRGSQHGADTVEDCNVPLVLSMPGLGANRFDDSVSVTQVARTIANYLGFAMESADSALPLVHEMRKK